jgi:hypothetical protein
MSVGVMKDYKPKLRNSRVSHTLGWLLGELEHLRFIMLTSGLT